jgi:hypothetical protein
MVQQMSPLLHSSSLPQSSIASAGSTHTSGYDRSTGRQASPDFVSHFESPLQNRGQTDAG